MNTHGCIDCHLPNQLSTFRSTDLTSLLSVRGETRVREVLASGMPTKGMPNLGLSEADIEALVQFLARLGTIGSEVGSSYKASIQATGGSLADLPWFEYAR